MLEAFSSSRYGANAEQVARAQFLFGTGDAVDDDQSIKATLREPFKHRGCEGDIRLVTELDFRSEHPNAIALIDADRVLGDLVVNESHSREILVHHRTELLKSERFDDVRGGDDTDHASGGEAANSDASCSRVCILMEDQRVGLQVRIHGLLSDKAHSRSHKKAHGGIILPRQPSLPSLLRGTTRRLPRLPTIRCRLRPR